MSDAECSSLVALTPYSALGYMDVDFAVRNDVDGPAGWMSLPAVHATAVAFHPADDQATSHERAYQRHGRGLWIRVSYLCTYAAIGTTVGNPPARRTNGIDARLLASPAWNAARRAG
ncbi:hypothetical protein [Micromonospora saelicesensis]|uniref:hypothetical protein n=1 Tax=Micromonospora saelicesensis TaxID=285676 RepID=UPI0011BF3E0A|nr:hypothetical protein [Micromonospora saelicesensis]